MKSVELLGLKEANAALRKLPEFVALDAQQEMNTTAFQVSRAAASRAPSRTGLLRSVINWKARKGSAIVTILKTAFYWKYLEFGTVKLAARPFLRPAAEQFRDDHRRRLSEALIRSANKVEKAQGPIHG